MSGEKVTVTVKIYDDKHPSNWASISFSRSVRFWAEAQQTESNVFKAIATYYALFHFSSFLLFLCKVDGSQSPQTKIENTIDNRRDPRRNIQHLYADAFLAELERLGLEKEFLIDFRIARELREFVNYGPDLLREKSGLRVDNRKFGVDEVFQLASRCDRQMMNALEWFVSWHSEPNLIAGCIDRVSPYFVSHEDNDGKPYYRDWSSEGTRVLAENLVRRLYEIARGIS